MKTIILDDWIRTRTDYLSFEVIRGFVDREGFSHTCLYFLPEIYLGDFLPFHVLRIFSTEPQIFFVVSDYLEQNYGHIVGLPKRSFFSFILYLVGKKSKPFFKKPYPYFELNEERL